jgi:hypothetical protein
MSGKPGMRSKLRRTLPSRYGPNFVEVLDGRCRLAKEVRHRLQILMSDLGGEDNLSHQQRSLCARSVWLELVIGSEEARISSGEGIDHALHTQLIASLVRIYRLLGIRRVAREARLSDYLKRGES